MLKLNCQYSHYCSATSQFPLNYSCAGLLSLKKSIFFANSPSKRFSRKFLRVACGPKICCAGSLLLYHRECVLNDGNGQDVTAIGIGGIACLVCTLSKKFSSKLFNTNLFKNRCSKFNVLIKIFLAIYNFKR